MSRLIVDPISAKTLPVLDSLFATDKEKLTDLIMSTDGAALRRLFKASVARQTVLGYPEDAALQVPAKLLELLIHNNLLSVDGDDNEAEFDAAVEAAGVAGVKVMLSTSIARFNIL